jgi:hypothetical protein
VQYGVELLSTTGQEIRGTAIYRVLIPVSALVLFGLALSLPFEIEATAAVACWGLGWALGLAVMAIEIRRGMPPAIWAAPAREEARTWGREALPFLTYSLSLTVVAQTGVIALDRLQPSAVAVGAYAAASGTATLVVVLATATNRFYAPRISMLLERRDFAAMLDLRRERFRWLLPAVAAFLVAIFGFGREILTLFRPEFVEEGIGPLRILAISVTFTAVFSLSPTYLKYQRRNRLVLGTVAGAAAGQLVLLALLVPGYGATGAAVAYAISMCAMYGVFSRVASREVVRLRAEEDGRKPIPKELAPRRSIPPRLALESASRSAAREKLLAQRLVEGLVAEPDGEERRGELRARNDAQRLAVACQLRPDARNVGERVAVSRLHVLVERIELVDRPPEPLQRFRRDVPADALDRGPGERIGRNRPEVLDLEASRHVVEHPFGAHLVAQVERRDVALDEDPVAQQSDAVQPQLLAAPLEVRRELHAFDPGGVRRRGGQQRGCTGHRDRSTKHRQDS